PDDWAANRGGCDRISLRRTSMRPKILPNSPEIRGMSVPSLPPCSGPPLASHSPGPPQRASIPVLALEAQPPTGLPSRSTCRGAGPLQVLKTRGFEGDSRQAGPVRPVYNADQPITALKGTGIRTFGPPQGSEWLSRANPTKTRRMSGTLVWPTPRPQAR